MTPDLDRIKGPLVSFVRGLFPHLVYLAKWPSRVVQQRADGTLDLQPDAADVFAGLVGVPIRLGIPGAAVKVAGGSRVLLGFEGGKPDKPVAELWDAASVTELAVNGTLITFNGGSASVARVGDSVTATAGPGGMAAWMLAVSAFTGIPAPLGGSFGTITSGAPGVKA